LRGSDSFKTFSNVTRPATRETLLMRKERLLPFLVILLSVVVVKVGQQLYRWHAYRDERAEIVRLETRLDSAAVGLVTSRIRASALRDSIEAADEHLDTERRRLDSVERTNRDGIFDEGRERAYRTQIAAFNRDIRSRNELVRRWRAAIESNHGHVDRFNLFADSIRAIAMGMKEPYFPIRTPAEIAAEHGIVTVPDTTS
jgi:hypothetical protein